MSVALFAIISVAITVLTLGIVFFLLKKNAGGGPGGPELFKAELEKRKALQAEIESLYGQMTDIKSLQTQGKSLITIKEALKTERGRATITQAELETVEARLRELEEIERELAASSIDTQEEIKILEKKKVELASKNVTLKEQITLSMSKMDTVLGELELSAQMLEQVEAMKMEILQTQEKIELILLQIELANEQYFVLKKRYDALDIEYAQLYEKFSAGVEASKEKE